MSTTKLVEPHGGRLVDRTGAQKDAADPAVSITLSPHEECDWEMIAIGAMSPLEGFVGEADFLSICDNMTLADGTAWPIPITCAVDNETADRVEVGSRVALNDASGRLLGYLNVAGK